TEVVVINKTDFDLFLNEIEHEPGYEGIGYESFETWEGIIEASEAYYNWTARDSDIMDDGKALFGLDAVANFIFSSHMQLGEELMTVSDGIGTLNLKSAALRKVWDSYYTPMVKGYYASFGRFRSDDMKTGDILAFLGSSTSGAYLPDAVVNDDGSTYPIETAVMPMPCFSGGTPSAIQQGAGVAIIKSTEEREVAAAQFMLWCTQPERNIDFATKSSYLPVTVEAIDTLAAAYAGNSDSDPQTAVLRTAIEQIASGYLMYVPPVFEDSYKIRNILETELVNAAGNNRSQVVSEMTAGAGYDYTVGKYTDSGYYNDFLDVCTREMASLNVNLVR
ncbi:MAG: extracellular solute-binding protein, partial [Oscillospiraceae bacterium]|nr:extracellular solute-binding protein [Oscillospiraceae bacterium]